MLQPSFLALAHNKKRLKSEKFLDVMNNIISWDDFIKIIEPHYQENILGRKKKDLKLMLKIYFLQQWYNLSDPGTEEAIYDRNSFQKFLGIDLLSSDIPDETTILNFRHLLEEHELQKEMFEAINRTLTEKGLIMKTGTTVDATIIEASSNLKNREKQRDPEMAPTRKGPHWHYGMKVHIGTDNRNGLVHTMKATPANISDHDVYEYLLTGQEKSIFGDKGYFSIKRKQVMRKNGIFCGILDKGTRNHKLTNKQKRKNSKLSAVRCGVEHIFKIVKDQWGHARVRYHGLFKNAMQMYILFGLANIYKVRKKLCIG
jgi:IS5 family transposase